MSLMQVVLAHADPGVRSRFTRVLSHVGHDVRAVDGRGRRRRACREQPPDVVLVDVELCRDDQQALLAALKGDAEAYRSAVVLLERPGLDLDTAVAALRGGAQDFLVEPLQRRRADRPRRARPGARRCSRRSSSCSPSAWRRCCSRTR